MFEAITRRRAGLFAMVHLVLAVTSICNAQYYQWSKQFGGSGSDEGNGIIIDASGNVYTTGTFSGTIDLDPGVGVTTATSIGQNDVFISKIDGSGNFIWGKTLGGSGDDRGISIAVDATGNVYIAGIFRNSVDFDPGPSVLTLTTGVNTTSSFALKLNSLGNFIWAKNATNSSQPTSIAVDLSGNVYLSGYFSGVVDFNPSTAINTLTCASNWDGYIWKLNSLGNYIWVRQIGNNQPSDYANDLTLDAAGNVYTTGFYSASVDFDPGPNTVIRTSNGAEDIFVLKLDALGDFVWVNTLGAASTDTPRSIALDGSNNVIVVGSFANSVDFDSGPGTTVLSSNGAFDLFVLKLNSTGSFVWAKSIGGNNSDTGVDAKVDALNNIYITGIVSNLVDMDPGPSIVMMNITTSFFVLKLDANGSYVWAKTPSSTTFGSAAPKSMHVDAQANIYVTGALQGTIDIDPGPLTTTISAQGNTDAYVLKLCNLTMTTTALSTSICNGATITLGVSGANTYTWSNSSITPSIAISPTSGANYTVFGLSAGCLAYSIFTVQVYQPPTISANDHTICSNKSATLSAYAGGTVTYLWSNSSSSQSVVVSPSLTTIYTLTVTNSFSCSSLKNVTVTVNPIPILTITPSSNYHCTGKSTTLTAMGANSYSWNTGLPTSSIVVNPSATISYSVRGTSISGCTNTAVKTLSVTNPPSAGISGGNFLCAGQSATLSVFSNNAQSFLWNSGSTNTIISVSPSVTTIYSVTANNTITGCSSLKSHTITVLPIPVFSLVASNTLTCINSSVLISAIGSNGSFMWSVGSSFTNSIVVYPSSPTTISSTLNVSGCIHTASISVNTQTLPTVSLSSFSPEICLGRSTSLIASGANTYTLSFGVLNGVPFTPSITATYSVQGTNTLTGCTSSNAAVQTISIIPLPVVTSSISSPLVCPGSTVILKGQGADTYTWSGGIFDGIPFSPSAVGTFSVFGTNTLTGCTSKIPSIQTINFAPIPNVVTSFVPAIFCTGITSTLLASGANSYTWANGPQTSSMVVTPQSAAIFSVTGMNTFGCINTATVALLENNSTSFAYNLNGATLSLALTNITCTNYTWTIGNGLIIINNPNPTITYELLGEYKICLKCAGLPDACEKCFNISVPGNSAGGVSVNEEFGNFNVSIYPVPTNDILIIESNAFYNREYILFNAIGQQIISSKLDGEITSLDLKSYTPGIYFLRIQGQEKQVYKVIKE